MATESKDVPSTKQIHDALERSALIEAAAEALVSGVYLSSRMVESPDSWIRMLPTYLTNLRLALGRE